MTHLKEKQLKQKLLIRGTLTLNSDKVLLPNGNTSTENGLNILVQYVAYQFYQMERFLIRQYAYAVKKKK